MSLAKNKKKFIRGTVFIAALVVLLVISNYLAARLSSIDASFEYTVDLNSQDHFYNPKLGKYSEVIETTNRFSYIVEDETKEGLTVVAIFDVRKPTGEKVISVIRKYGIDPKKLKHTQISGLKERNGYLFGPRDWLEGFEYWHINYDQPLRMEFLGWENIKGLKVAVYHASEKIDQTMDLQHLPGVPHRYGINLDVKLKLWIDPLTGWLIKFEDRAIAYYYDQSSKLRVHSWNQFQNVVSKKSVEKNIEISRSISSVYEVFGVYLPVIIWILLGLGIFYFFILPVFRLKAWKQDE